MFLKFCSKLLKNYCVCTSKTFSLATALANITLTPEVGEASDKEYIFSVPKLGHFKMG